MHALVLSLWFQGALVNALYAQDFPTAQDCVDARKAITAMANEGRKSNVIEYGQCILRPAPERDHTDTDVEDDDPTLNFLKDA